MRQNTCAWTVLGASLCAMQLFLVGVAQAESADDCAKLMDKGIYDRYRSFTTEYQFKQVQSFFKSYHFDSRQSAESKAGTLGIGIEDILSVNFAGKSSSTQFAQWQDELTRASYDQYQSNHTLNQAVDTISSKITDLVGTCLAQRGLHAYIVPTPDPKTFSYNITFIGLGSSHSATKGTFTITPATVANSCSPANMVGREVTVGLQGLSITCRRVPTETVVVTANFEDGSPIVKYDAFVPPQPSVQFDVTPTTMDFGQQATLSWDVTNADNVTLVGTGEVQSAGHLAVSPSSTTSYRLEVRGLDGRTRAAIATVNVNPPPPTLTRAKVQFHTTGNDKDHDTNVTTNVICGGSTVAAASGEYGHFNDNSDSGWIDLNVVSHPRKDSIHGLCQNMIVERPNGHDEWHFDWTLILGFSDGNEQRYDFQGGNVDHDRTTVTKGL